MTNTRGTELALLLTGALLGAATVALTTPWSGRRTRQLIRRKIEDGTEQVSQATIELCETGQGWWRRAASRFA